MPINLRRCLAVALLGVALWSHPGVAAKIDRFQDDQGTLHITNHGETPADKSGTGAKPVRRRLSKAEAFSREGLPVPPPPPQALETPPPGAVPPPPQEEAALPEPAAPPSRARLAPLVKPPPPPPGPPTVGGTEPAPNLPPLEGRFDRSSRGGGRR